MRIINKPRLITATALLLLFAAEIFATIDLMITNDF